MKYVIKYEGFDSINEDIFGRTGRFLGKVGGKLTGNSSTKIETTDNDLAKEILNHLNSLPSDYNKSGKYKMDNVHSSQRDIYTFFMKFKRDPNQLYKIDVIRHLDYKTTKDPEYTIIINKTSGNPGGNPDDGNPDDGNPNDGNSNDGNPDDGNPDDGNPDDGNPDSGNSDGGNPNGGNPDGGANPKPKPTPNKICFNFKDFTEDEKSQLWELLISREYHKLLKLYKKKRGKDPDEETKKKLKQKADKKVDKIIDELLKKESLLVSFKDYILLEEVTQKNYGGHGEQISTGGKDKRDLGTVVDRKKSEYIKCDQNMAKKVFLKAEELFKVTRKTHAGDARGGSNES